MKAQYNRRQMLYLAFVVFLAPATRLIPETTAALSGSGSWLAPLIALPFALLYLLFLDRFLKNRKSGEGMAEVILRASGARLGGSVLFIIGVYMFFYCGFLLRSGASRFITTIYSESDAGVFIATGLILGTIAALGPMKAVVRSAKLFGIFIIGVELFVLLLSLDGVDFDRLLPIFDPDLSALLMGATPVVNVFLGILAYVSFAEFGQSVQGGRFKSYALWLVLCSLLLTLITAAIVGSYGAKLTSTLVHPFFTLTRGISLLNALERVEAFIVAVWIFPDFIMLGLLLSCGMRCLRLSFGFKPKDDGEKMLSMQNGRFLIIPGLCLTLAVALLIPQKTSVLKLFSELIVPILNCSVALVLLPLCFVAGKLRKRI